MKIIKITRNYISEYLVEVRSKGRFAITLDELRGKFDVSKKALLQNLYRLKTKNKIAQIRKEFYVIIPPQYSNRGMLPASLFIDDMMKFLDREYYVGLFSAAAMYGAGHQQPMVFHVITKKPAMRNIKNQKLVISFFTKKEWDKDQIIEKKTEAGYINVSRPELTAFDLIYYNDKIDGINRIIHILDDLREEMKPSFIVRSAKKQKTTTIQRLGYLLNEIGEEILSDSLYNVIKTKKPKEIPLSLVHTKRTGNVDGKWKIIINTMLDL